MNQSTAIVGEGMKIGSELTQALEKIGHVVAEFNRLAQEIGTATTEQSDVSSRIAQATWRLNEITHEISSAVHQQTEGTESAVKALERMRGTIQRFSSGAVELAATADSVPSVCWCTAELISCVISFKRQVACAIRQGTSGYIVAVIPGSLTSRLT